MTHFPQQSPARLDDRTLSAARNKTPLFTESRGECRESRSFRAYVFLARLFRTVTSASALSRLPSIFFSIFLSFRAATAVVGGGRACTRLATSNARACSLKMKSSPLRNLILTVISRTRARAVYESVQRFHRRVGFRTGVARWYNFEEEGTRINRERERDGARERASETLEERIP